MLAARALDSLVKTRYGDSLVIVEWHPYSTDALNIKMGRLTRDSFTRPNREAGVAMLLGYSI